MSVCKCIYDVCMYMYVIYLHTHLSSVVNVITLLCMKPNKCSTHKCLIII